MYPRGMSHGAWLQEQLFERRIVLVTGRLDDDAATKAAAALLALDARGNRPIELHLDSPDGALGAAFALIDTADTLRSTLRVPLPGPNRRPCHRRGRGRRSLRRRTARAVPPLPADSAVAASTRVETKAV